MALTFALCSLLCIVQYYFLKGWYSYWFNKIIHSRHELKSYLKPNKTLGR